MIDQATELRKLVIRAMREGTSPHGPAPRLVMLTSGRRHVGVTTLGVNLAVAMSEQGQRVVLVDTDGTDGRVADLCGLPAASLNADLLGARRDIHEVLQLGPAGIQVVAGLRVDTREAGIGRLAIDRLVRQFTKLGKHADTVLLDVGHGETDLVRRLGQAANDIVVVTTAENASVTDAYAHIKLSLSGATGASRWLVVNSVQTTEQGLDVHRRVRQSCERFLGHGVDWLGCVPQDAAVSEGARQAIPFTVGQPNCPASQAIQQIAYRFTGRGERTERPRAAA